MRTKSVLLIALLGLALLSPVCSAIGAEYVPGEIIVKFKEGAGEDAIWQIAASHGASVIYTSPYAGFKRVRIPRNRKVEKMVELFRTNPNVEYAVPNSIAHAHLVPNDPGYNPYQWNFDDQPPNGNPYGGENGGGINLEPAWDISRGSGVVVAILDTGVAYQDYGSRYRKAPDLALTSFVVGWDFVTDDSHPNDDNSHGTHVTGTVAQNTNNGIGVAGVAFECSIMPVKVLDRNGDGTLQQVVDGIYYAVDNGANVINMSLGWPAGYDPGEPVKQALDYAYDHDVTVVCSSGNNGASTVSYPAAHWTTIAVGASRFDETRPLYSNYGTALDLTAPGGDLSVDQNGDGAGDGILQNTFSPISQNPRDFDYWLFSGTSMAAPHVSGVSALLIAHGVVTPDDVRHAMVTTAEDKGAPGWDTEYGWGIVDAYAALNAPPNEPRRFTLSDAMLFAFQKKFGSVSPGLALLNGKQDVGGLGVNYSVGVYGFGPVEIGIGGAPPETNLSGYAFYELTFTNVSADDFFGVGLYVKTGPDNAYVRTGWAMLAPGQSMTRSLDLSSVANPNDVREIGFGLRAWIGDGFGWANSMPVKVERAAPEH